MLFTPHLERLHSAKLLIVMLENMLALHCLGWRVVLTNDHYAYCTPSNFTERHNRFHKAADNAYRALCGIPVKKRSNRRRINLKSKTPKRSVNNVKVLTYRREM